ncbi:hypothetical protein QUB47_01040 [Microcoleus sp. AT9_B5]
MPSFLTHLGLLLWKRGMLSSFPGSSRTSVACTISSAAGFAGTDCTGFLTYNNPPTAQRTIVEIPAIREKRFGFSIMKVNCQTNLCTSSTDSDSA